MPYIYVKLGYNEELPKIERKINPLPTNLVWIRGVDFIPILTTIDEINWYEEKLKERRKKK